MYIILLITWQMDNIHFNEFEKLTSEINGCDEETLFSIEMLDHLILSFKDIGIKNTKDNMINNKKNITDVNIDADKTNDDNNIIVKKLNDTYTELGFPIITKKITHYKNMSCIYLICLGYIREIRNIYNIDPSYPDDAVLCKYGLTKNLERRLKEHNSDYGFKLNKEIYLKFFVKISQDKLYYAENILEDIFINLGLKYDRVPKKTELVIIPRNELESIKNEYDKIRIYLLKYDVLHI